MIGCYGFLVLGGFWILICYFDCLFGLGFSIRCFEFASWLISIVCWFVRGFVDCDYVVGFVISVVSWFGVVFWGFRVWLFGYTPACCFGVYLGLCLFWLSLLACGWWCFGIV